MTFWNGPRGMRVLMREERDAPWVLSRRHSPRQPLFLKCRTLRQSQGSPPAAGFEVLSPSPSSQRYPQVRAPFKNYLLMCEPVPGCSPIPGTVSRGARLSIPAVWKMIQGAPEGGEPAALRAQARRHHGQLPATSSSRGLWPWVSGEVVHFLPRHKALGRWDRGNGLIVRGGPRYYHSGGSPVLRSLWFLTTS